MEWMPAGVDGSGRKLRALQRSGRWWLEHPEWMPTRLHRTGWKLCALPESDYRNSSIGGDAPPIFDQQARPQWRPGGAQLRRSAQQRKSHALAAAHVRG